ncbi:ribonuclease H-like domain-containing protein, partial [Tanacetum coccineum]
FPNINDYADKPVAESSDVKTSKAKPVSVKKDCGALIIEVWESDSDEEDESKTIKPNYAKIEFVRPKPARKLVEQIRQDTNSPSNKARGNQRNWNNMVSQRLGSDYEVLNKPCYVCGSFNHLQKDCSKRMVKPVWNYSQRVNHKNFSRLTHPNPKRNIVPRAVLMRKGLVPLTTAKVVNTVQPRLTVNTKKNSNFYYPVNTVKGSWVNTARPKAILKAVKGNLVNAVKASAYLSTRQENMSYFADNEQIDKGYVAFGDMGEGSGQPTDPQHTFTSAQLSNKEQITVSSSFQLKKTYTHRKPKKVTKIPQSSEPNNLVKNEAVYERCMTDWKGLLLLLLA